MSRQHLPPVIYPPSSLAVGLVLLVTGMGGCDEADARPHDAGPRESPGANASTTDAGFASCEEIQQRAGTLVAAAQGCDTGDECILVGGGECLDAFLCGVSVNANSDLDLLQRQANSLSDAWKDKCSSEGCEVASCVLVEPECDTHLRRCVYVFPGDADAG